MFTKYDDNFFLYLRGFYYTELFKSVSVAAEALGVTQPAVSLQIKSLQKSLGKTLL